MQLYNTALVEGEEILQLIPHRAPFVMVEKLLFADAHKTVSSFSFNAANIFVRNGMLTEPALIENIAQTAALKIGYELMLERQKGNPNAGTRIGFIGGINNLKIYKLAQSGTEIQTEVFFEKEVLDVSIIKGSITQLGSLIAECEMKIFVKKDR